jgi:hypothetical protein
MTEPNVIEMHATERFCVTWDGGRLKVNYLTSKGWYTHESFAADQFEDAVKSMNWLSTRQIKMYVNSLGEVDWWVVA